jgi:hypothetical protein
MKKRRRHETTAIHHRGHREKLELKNGKKHEYPESTE